VKGKIKKLWSIFKDDSGQGMVEYMLIIGLVVLFIVVLLVVFRKNIEEFIKYINDFIKGLEKAKGA